MPLKTYVLSMGSHCCVSSLIISCATTPPKIDAIVCMCAPPKRTLFASSVLVSDRALDGHSSRVTYISRSMSSVSAVSLLLLTETERPWCWITSSTHDTSSLKSFSRSALNSLPG